MQKVSLPSPDVFRTKLIGRLPEVAGEPLDGALVDVMLTVLRSSATYRKRKESVRLGSIRRIFLTSNQ
jgi:hypothetical protein